MLTIKSKKGNHDYCGWGSCRLPTDQKIKRVKMSNFDERSGMVYCKTSWGQWGQTIEEVFIEVDVTEGTKARDIQCDIKPKAISVTVSNKLLIQVLLLGQYS